ncbi:hypothetical protein [Herminiimonas fonticola]|uniref:hypothetical protein n=1 Tax=Herminiimonas fonticola TaxID=303380 RepID=UPI003340277A
MKTDHVVCKPTALAASLASSINELKMAGGKTSSRKPKSRSAMCMRSRDTGSKFLLPVLRLIATDLL